MRLTIASLLCFVVPAVQGALPFGREPQKVAIADCKYVQDDNAIELRFHVTFNGDPTQAFLATEGEELRNSDGTLNIPFCDYQGDLTSHVSLTSKVYMDGRASVNPCGVQETFTGSNVYRWYFQTREYWDGSASVGIVTDIDVMYLTTCDLSNSQQNIASPSAVVNVRELDGESDATRVDEPSSRMSILTGTGFVQSQTSGIRRGEAIKLLVQTQVKTDGFRNENLDPYGSFVHTCAYRTSFTGQETTFITTNGCPNNQFQDLFSGFIYQRVDSGGVNSYHWYESETDNFVLAQINSNFARYYITCYIGFCYGQFGTDGRCTDYCNSNRFRRSIENESSFEKISISVDIIDEDGHGDEGTQQQGRTGAESGTLVVAIVSGVTIIVLVAIIVLVIMVCLRRRQGEREDWPASSSAGSNVNLPQHMHVQVRKN